MDAKEFRRRGKEMVDYVADYLENIQTRRPLSDVQPGYLRQLIPGEAPQDPESWDQLFPDIERVIMPGQQIRFLQFVPTFSQMQSDVQDSLGFKDSSDVVDAFNVDPLYLKHENQGAVPDYRHWQIPLGRRFRSLKIWFVLRLYGVKGIQDHIRKVRFNLSATHDQIITHSYQQHVRLAHEFEELVKKNSAFEVTHEVTLGLVCFRLKADRATNETLLQNINKDGRIHMVPSESKGKYFLRFAVCAASTESKDITFAWEVIQELADQLTQILK
ncbi:hypothetical protein CAPTEDRAFT_214615 [Capitella teleta]|uniref:Aromatic-L-amino-acid decarboxylase n=1 Tax=Capitella teleta TaxID=283909 RepID=R7UG01_CAPTE|nr:hypothetical protein CAPTEDRAFT_214615 [Capitella teleta]|eukprot:ELU05115.1 hypothetical protein CAPTEDRAFT_214615 [Capitella teleta]